MIPFHCPISRVSLIRGNLRLCGKPTDKHANAGVAGGLVVSSFAILVAVFNSDVTRVLIDNAFVGGATRDQSATQAARTNRPCAKYR